MRVTWLCDLAKMGLFNLLEIYFAFYERIILYKLLKFCSTILYANNYTHIIQITNVWIRPTCLEAKASDDIMKK